MKTKILLFTFITSLLCSCSAFFDKDNTPPPAPLKQFTPETTIHSLWTTHPNNGSGKEYLRLKPAYSNQTIYTASYKGTVTAIDSLTGKKRWEVSVGHKITGGLAADTHLVLVGSQEGDVFALNPDNGALLWKAHATSEIFAPPAIGQNLIVTKSVDGQLSAFSKTDGQLAWHYQQIEPTLILRSSSSPQLTANHVVAGFANGNLVKLTLRSGSLLWQNTLATPSGSFAIDRMIDIDADPIIFDNDVYAATYQGHIAAIDFTSGESRWTKDISSYTGLTVDARQVYVTDAHSHVWAFDHQDGHINWDQAELEARKMTGPVLMDNYLVVGDGEGYLHWLSRNDGHVVARTRVAHSAIVATPIVVNHVLYVVTQDGHLSAYTY